MLVRSNMPPLWAASIAVLTTSMVERPALTTKAESTMLFAEDAVVMILVLRVHQALGHLPTRVPIVI